MIDRIVTWALSNPKADKLVVRIMATWLLVIVARVVGQILGGV